MPSIGQAFSAEDVLHSFSKAHIFLCFLVEIRTGEDGGIFLLLVHYPNVRKPQSSSLPQ